MAEKKNVDSYILQLQVERDELKRTIRNSTRVSVFSQVMMIIMVLALIAAVFFSSGRVRNIENRYLKKAAEDREALLQGMYSVTNDIQSSIPTRSERLKVYVKKGKYIILHRNSKTDLTDKEINRLLLVNFDLAEKYLMNPMIFLAYAAVESDFTKKAVSSAGAKGIVQFMPYTLKLVLRERYTPGIEFDPVEECRAWYEYIHVLTESVGGDFLWTACAYMSPLAIKFYNQKKTVDDFMSFISRTTNNGKDYPHLIQSLYNQYKIF